MGQFKRPGGLITYLGLLTATTPSGTVQARPFQAAPLSCVCCVAFGVLLPSMRRCVWCEQAQP